MMAGFAKRALVTINFVEILLGELQMVMLDRYYPLPILIFFLFLKVGFGIALIAEHGGIVMLMALSIMAGFGMVIMKFQVKKEN